MKSEYWVPKSKIIADMETWSKTEVIALLKYIRGSLTEGPGMYFTIVSLLNQLEEK